MTETTTTQFETARHASFAAKQQARKVEADAPADRDDARRMFKRMAKRAEHRFDIATDETVRTFEAVFASEMKVRAEARS